LSASAVALLIALLAQDGAASTAPAEPAPAEAPAPTPAAPLPYEPPAVRPFEMPLSTPSEPVPYSPGALDRIPEKPVTVEAYRRDYEAPPDAREQVYQAGVRRNFDAQQSRMGPLDGQWTVRTETGQGFMSLVIVDTGRPDAEISGAWRSLGGRSATGFLLSVAKEGEFLVVRWYERDTTGELTIMRLRQSPDGRWTGTVRSRDREVPVTMTRGA